MSDRFIMYKWARVDIWPSCFIKLFAAGCYMMMTTAFTDWRIWTKLVERVECVWCHRAVAYRSSRGKFTAHCDLQYF